MSVLGKYSAINILVGRESRYITNLQACLHERARLKQSRSLNPRTPYAFPELDQSHLLQILDWLS